MRVRRQPDIRSLIALGEVVSLDRLLTSEDGDDLSLLDFVEAPNPPEDPNELVTSDIFAKMSPGRERVCMVLLSEGFTQRTIGMITGLTESQVRTVVTTVRRRLLQPRLSKALPLRVWNTREKRMFFATDPAQARPKEACRLMPWTGYRDREKRPIYLWDIVSCQGQTRIVRHFRNQTAEGYSPFDSQEERADWLGSATAIGNIWQHPERMPQKQKIDKPAA